MEIVYFYVWSVPPCFRFGPSYFFQALRLFAAGMS
jgi:hypothetical protein